MISSPCKTCSKRQMAKDSCVRTCELIKAIQLHQYLNPTPPYTCDDCEEANAYRSTLPASKGTEP